MKSPRELLFDVKFLYSNAEISEKQALLKLVFDSSLYYKDGVYRTQSIMDIFQHNLHILNQKRLLELDEKKGLFAKVPLGGAAGNRTLVQTYSPQAFYMFICTLIFEE